MFGLWAPELFVFDLNIGFLFKSLIFSPQEMSRNNANVGAKMINMLFESVFFVNTKSGLVAVLCFPTVASQNTLRPLIIARGP